MSGRLERGQGQLVGAHGAGQRVTGQAGDDVGPTQQDPCLGAAEQLVAAGDHHIGAVTQRGGDVGLPGQQRLRGEQPAAEIHDERHSRRAARAGQLGDLDLAGESDDAIVAGVDAQHAAGPLPQRPRVVGQVGAVGGADLVEAGAGGGDEVREPEAGPDLDELAAADDHLAGAGQRGGGEQERRGAVVDHQGVLRLRAGGEQGRAGAGAASRPGSRAQVELDVGVSGCGLDGATRRCGQRCPAEVGVHDDPGGVEHRPQGGCGPAADRGEDLVEHLLGRDLPASCPVLRGADDVPHHTLAQAVARPPDLRLGEQVIGARNATARVGRGVGSLRGLGHRNLLGPCRRPRGADAQVAEADGNRTRQTEMLGLTGFEDQGAHQDTDASVGQTITVAPGSPASPGAPMRDRARQRPGTVRSRWVGSGHERLTDRPCPGRAVDPSDDHGPRRGLRLEDPAGRARGGRLRPRRASSTTP